TAMPHVRVEAHHQVGVGMLLDRFDGDPAAYDTHGGTLDLAAVADRVIAERDHEADAMVGADIDVEASGKGALEHEQPVLERQDRARQGEIPRVKRRAGAEAEHLVGTKLAEVREALDAEDARRL